MIPHCGSLQRSPDRKLEFGDGRDGKGRGMKEEEKWREEEEEEKGGEGGKKG